MITVGKCSDDASLPNSQSYIIVLWDEQTALSLMFEPGDNISLHYPYIHNRERSIAEHQHIYEECSPNANQHLFIEYGSSTVLFIEKAATHHDMMATQSYVPENSMKSTASNLKSSTDSKFAHFEAPKDEHTGFLNLEYFPYTLDWSQMPVNCMNLHMLAVIVRIEISHGSSLLSAFTEAFYGTSLDKCNPDEIKNHSFDSQCNYPKLVVLLTLQDAECYNYCNKGRKRSGEIKVELTGKMAETSLGFQTGHSIFLKGLTLVAITESRLSAIRHKQHITSQSCGVAGTKTLAFTDAQYCEYTATVGLCAPWKQIMGQQSRFVDGAMYNLNEMPGIYRSIDFRKNTLIGDTKQVQKPKRNIIKTNASITRSGWLVKTQNSRSNLTYIWDTSCSMGFSTRIAHRCCMESCRVYSKSDDILEWICEYCQIKWSYQNFSEDTDVIEAFGDLAVEIDDGSKSCIVLVSKYAVDSLLEISPSDYDQLSIAKKSSILLQLCLRNYVMVLSSCEERTIIPHKDSHSEFIKLDTRIDHIIPLESTMSSDLYQTLKATQAVMSS